MVRGGGCGWLPQCVTPPPPTQGGEEHLPSSKLLTHTLRSPPPPSTPVIPSSAVQTPLLPSRVVPSPPSSCLSHHTASLYPRRGMLPLPDAGTTSQVSPLWTCVWKSASCLATWLSRGTKPAAHSCACLLRYSYCAPNAIAAYEWAAAAGSHCCTLLLAVCCPL